MTQLSTPSAADGSTVDGAHLRLPPEEFYWSLLELPPALRRHRSSKLDPDQLGYLLEGDLPVPLEGVHAAYISVDAVHVVACALPIERVRELAAVHPYAAALTPAAIPDFIKTNHPELAPDAFARLNLFKGPFEPPAAKRHRRRLRVSVSAGVLVLAALLVVGLERRTASLNTQSAAIAAYETELYDQLVPAAPQPLPRAAPHRPLPPGVRPAAPASEPVRSLPHPAIRLTAELRRLRLTRGQAAASTRDVTTSQDAAIILANLLAAWPTSSSPLYVETESLTIAPTGLNLSAVLPDQDTAQRFQAELGSPPGFTKQQPQITAERGIVHAAPGQPQPAQPIRVVVHFLPISTPSSAGGAR